VDTGENPPMPKREAGTEFRYCLMRLPEKVLGISVFKKANKNLFLLN
jgi:hypothetical protein